MDNLEDFIEVVKKNEFTPMRELIFQYIREVILSGRLNPGDHLIEEELAKRLNVSRTPIREAIRKLELEGLVERSPRRGVVVRNFSLAEAEEIYDLRSVLEGYAAKLAATNINSGQVMKLKVLLEKMKKNMRDGNRQLEMDQHREWLSTLYAASKNNRLERLLNDYADYLRFFRSVSLQNPGRLNATGNEHELLLEAIEMGDENLAEKRAREHVVKAKEAFLSQYPNVSKYNTFTKN